MTVAVTISSHRVTVANGHESPHRSAGESRHSSSRGSASGSPFVWHRDRRRAPPRSRMCKRTPSTAPTPHATARRRDPDAGAGRQPVHGLDAQESPPFFGFGTCSTRGCPRSSSSPRGTWRSRAPRSASWRPSSTCATRQYWTWLEPALDVLSVSAKVPIAMSVCVAVLQMPGGSGPADSDLSVKWHWQSGRADQPECQPRSAPSRGPARPHGLPSELFASAFSWSRQSQPD